MKPIVTRVVLANARHARALENHGVGKGLIPISGATWTAQPAVENASKAGATHSIAGHGAPAMDQGDPQFQADLRFVRELVDILEDGFKAQKFDRLVLVAGPYIMGLLRQHLSVQLQALVEAEVTKDLTGLTVPQIEQHLGNVMAI